MSTSNNSELFYPKLSVTISTYNVESFIGECLESILGQTFKDFEMICIDDGSKDDTPKILKSFAKNDDRIKLILKNKNEGLAVSRNDALKLAKGKYITFLDGDDLYGSEMIEMAYNLAEKDQSDLVLWDYHVFFEPSELKGINPKESELKNLNVTDKIALLQRPAFTWVKLLKTKKAKELKIHFPVGRTRQDIPVHWHLVTALDNISILPEKLAYYRQQSEATTSQKDKRVFDLAYVMDETKNYLLSQNLYEKYKNEFLRQRLNLLYGMYDSVKKEFKLEARKLIIERISFDERQYINSRKHLRKRARWFYKSLDGDLFSLLKRNIWQFIRYVYRGIKLL